MSDRDLSDRYARIRTALAMDPTPGPWVVDRLSGSGRLQVNAPSSHTVATICHNVYIPEEVHAANARLIAACDPDTIRSLLADRDELEKALHGILGYFRSGNSIPVERATIKADAPEIIFAKSVL